jgi:glucose-1-phosphate cytidylyltransferase
MKVVILAGGLGTRLSEETSIKPKPMVEIGGKPMLWHIMKMYSSYGFNDFVICLGYKGYLVKEYFANYFLHKSDVTIDLANNSIETHSTTVEPWKITLVDTGVNTMTGGRIKKIEKYIDTDTFMLTYGDGVSNVDCKELLKYHNTHGKYATLTAVQPGGKFGALGIEENNIISAFQEKIKGDGGWINGGFFVLNKKIFDYIKNDDQEIWERSPLEKLAKDSQLVSYKHHNFWRCMDTLKDKSDLEEMWNSGNAEWKTWQD